MGESNSHPLNTTETEDKCLLHMHAGLVEFQDENLQTSVALAGFSLEARTRVPVTVFSDHSTRVLRIKN